MGNFCVGDKQQEFTNQETTQIYEVNINGCYINIINGNILHNSIRGILNTGLDPNQFQLMQHPEMQQEICMTIHQKKIVKPKLPIIQRLPPGIFNQDFIINLKINYCDNRRELVEAYEEAIDLMFSHELDTVGYREGKDKFKDKIELLNNCECLIEAIFNKIKINKMIKQFFIFSADMQICQQYKNELKKQQHKYLSKNNSKYERCSTQEQLNESLTENRLQTANSFDQTDNINKNFVKSQLKRSFPNIFQHQQSQTTTTTG